jgi:hypothetical protein
MCCVQRGQENLIGMDIFALPKVLSVPPRGSIWFKKCTLKVFLVAGAVI